MIRRFKLHTRYPHLRSEGLTRRRNKGTRFQVRKRVAAQQKMPRITGSV